MHRTICVFQTVSNAYNLHDRLSKTAIRVGTGGIGATCKPASMAGDECFVVQRRRRLHRGCLNLRHFVLPTGAVPSVPSNVFLDSCTVRLSSILSRYQPSHPSEVSRPLLVYPRTIVRTEAASRSARASVELRHVVGTWFSSRGTAL